MRYIASFVFVIGLFISLPQVTQAVSFTTNDFITTWDTENTGTSANNQITIPGTGAGYSYSIYWESLSSSTATGTIATSTSASQTITFPEPGEYKVAIKGTYPRIYFNNAGDKLKILTVEQWGNIAWTSMANAFYGCANLTVPATDAPNLSGVTSMALMFDGATNFNSPINHWDVSTIASFWATFRRASSFNQPLDNWNMSNATRTDSMFHQASSFNQPLNSWDVSKVIKMYAMFGGAISFNQPLNNWNTASVTTMVSMLEYAFSFDQDLSSWDLTSISASTSDQWNGLNNMFIYTALSTQNLDSTLQYWAGQSLKSNVPFHLGLKTYSSTGQTALNTLRDTYNWTITEQYQAEYQEGDDYTLSGTTIQSPINLNGTTTPVEVIPSERCTFLKWSDDNTDNPRTDTLTDNLTVTAVTKCASQSSGNSSNSRYKKLLEFGNTTEAEAVKDKYLNTTPANPVTPTLETAITNIKTLTNNQAITNNPESRQQLISILQQLVQILRGMAGESS